MRRSKEILEKRSISTEVIIPEMNWPEIQNQSQLILIWDEKQKQWW